jgi:acyl-CoA reductase-like NAD-dependent aldehyde dehydrogenase
MSRMAEQQLYIHGGYVPATSGKTFETLNPATGKCWRQSRPRVAKTSTGR